jgi:copper chaperone CopZ
VGLLSPERLLRHLQIRMKQTRTLAIEGMSCDMCIRHVTRALMSVPGVETKNVDVGSARVEYDPAIVPEDKILDAVRLAGYPARLAN